MITKIDKENKDKKTEMIALKVTSEFKEKAKELAAKDDRSLSSYIVKLLRAEMKKTENQ